MGQVYVNMNDTLFVKREQASQTYLFVVEDRKKNETHAYYMVHYIRT